MTTPLSSDPYDILLGHNRWAIRQLLERAKQLTPDEFTRPFDIGPAAQGGLHDIITHMIGCIFRWADRIGEQTLRPSIEGRPPGDPAPMTRRSPEELIALLDRACEDFSLAVGRMKKENRLAEVRTWTFGSDSYRFNVAAAIIHVTNHGMHHRAQCMNIFKQLGRPVNADLDELEWQVAGEPR